VDDHEEMGTSFQEQHIILCFRIYTNKSEIVLNYRKQPNTYYQQLSTAHQLMQEIVSKAKTKEPILDRLTVAVQWIRFEIKSTNQ